MGRRVAYGKIEETSILPTISSIEWFMLIFWRFSECFRFQHDAQVDRGLVRNIM